MSVPFSVNNPYKRWDPQRPLLHNIVSSCVILCHVILHNMRIHICTHKGPGAIQGHTLHCRRTIHDRPICQSRGGATRVTSHTRDYQIIRGTIKLKGEVARGRGDALLNTRKVTAYNHLCIVLCYAILHCTMLDYTILYYATCTMLYCTRLCYTVAILLSKEMPALRYEHALH